MYIRRRRKAPLTAVLPRCPISATHLLLLLLTVSLTSLAAPVGDKDVATAIILTVEGKVELARKGSTQWSAAATNQVVSAGDRLRTALRSRATLRWSEMSVVRVNQLTSIELQPPR